jgi:serine/threonine protein kinase
MHLLLPACHQVTSLQIIESKIVGQYDGTKADVWAMGVLPCVLLIGKFPFEGDSVSTMAVPDPVKKIWLQQNKRRWSENELLKDQLKHLSPVLN